MGHVRINSDGALSGFMLTPANGSERDAMLEMSDGIAGLMLADKGFISRSLQAQLAEQNIELQTPFRKNILPSASKNIPIATLELRWV